MKKFSAIVILSTAILAFVLSSCKNTLTPGTSQIVFPASGVSYNKQVQPLFNVECNYSGCHDAADAAGGLDLTSYISMIASSPSPVITGDTTHSILIEWVESKIGPHDPPFVSILTPNQIQGLKTWVLEGAKDN